MNFAELAARRYSCRSFTNKPVEKEKIDQILEAGRIAPTASNCQPQMIKVCTDRKKIENIENHTDCHYNAPLAIFCCYDETKCWSRPADGHKSGEVDTAIVAIHMILQAFDLGIGSTWVGVFNPEMVKEMCNLPKTYVPVAILMLGYPDTVDGGPADHHYVRKPIQSMLLN